MTIGDTVERFHSPLPLYFPIPTSGKEKRSSGRKLRSGTEYRAYNVVH